MGEIGAVARLDYQRPKSARALPQQQKKKQAEWCRENASLRQRRSAIERDVNQLFRTRSDLQEDALALTGQEQADAAERRAEIVKVGRRLETQKAAMSSIKEEIRRLMNGEDVSEGLERTMEGLEDELYEFKCTMRKCYDDLVFKESSLSSEVEDLQGKLKEWEQKPRGDAFAAQAVTITTIKQRPYTPAKAPPLPLPLPSPPPPQPPPQPPSTTTTAAQARGHKSVKNASITPSLNCADGATNGGDGCVGAGSGGTVDGGEARFPGEDEVNGVDGDGNGAVNGAKGEREPASYVATVERINRLIQQEGGATGGWPQHEHDCFLRLWTQARSRGPKSGARPPPSSPADRAAVASLLHRAQNMLPARSAEEVREHLAWHQRNKGYNEEKRRLAKAWREQRQRQHQADVETAEPPGATPPPTRRSTTSGGGGRALVAPTEEQQKRLVAREREMERKRKEVDAWRAEKEAKEQQAKEREEAKRASRGARVDEERRRQRRLHEQVAAYRLERQREDNRRREVERMLAREEKRMVLSQADLEERAKRDLDQARARRQEASDRELQQKEAEEKRRAAAKGRWDGVPVDRSRLLRNTKASKERALEPEDLDDLEDARASLPAHCSRIAIGGRDLRFNAGRAVPAWRRGVL
eukprot:g16200.t1